MKFMITYRTPATYSDSRIYIEANSQEDAKDIFIKTFNNMNYFKDKGFSPKITDIKPIDNE